jgi:hypothetical protein
LVPRGKYFYNRKEDSPDDTKDKQKMDVNHSGIKKILLYNFMQKNASAG